MKKLIFIDYDDTIRKSDGSVSNRVKEAILKHKNIGNIIVIATSRPRYQAIDISKSVNGSCYIVSSNGAEIYDYKNNEVLYLESIDEDIVLKLIDYAYLYDVRLILSDSDIDYVTKNPYNENQVILDKEMIKGKKIKQCMFIDQNVDGVLKIKNIVKSIDKVSIVNEISVNDTYYEKWFSVGSNNASKGNALEFLSNYLGISINDTISIGDDYNDISMFLKSGFSVCVANGVDEVKSHVNYVTLSCEEDGVALYLENIL